MNDVLEGWGPTGRQGLLVPDHIVKAREGDEEEKKKAARSAMWGRLFSYYNAVMYGLAPGGAREKPFGTPSFHYLRKMAEDSVVDAVILNCRLAQVRRVARNAIGPSDVGWRVRHKRAEDPKFEETDRIRERCHEMEDLVARVNRPVHTRTKDVLVACSEEELTIDRKAMVIFRDGAGRPYSWHVIDGATVFPRIHVIFSKIAERKGNVPGWDSITYDQAAERLSYEYGVNLTDAEYVQVVDGQIAGAWKHGELAVDVTNPSVRMDDWGYGRGSILERSLKLSDAFTAAFMFNMEMLNTSIPEQILAVYGDVDPESMGAFRDRLLAEVGKAGWWRMPMIPGGEPDEFKIEAIPLRRPQKDMEFLDWLIVLVSLKCGFYRMHPGLINIHPRAGGAPLIEHDKSAEELVTMSQEEGFRQILSNFSDWLTVALIQPHYEDLALVWVGLDPQNEVQIEQLRTQRRAYRTLDEIRAEAGLPPLPDEPPEKVGDFIMDPYYMQALGQVGQEDQEMPPGFMAPGGGPGMGGPGGPPGGGPGGPPGGGMPKPGGPGGPPGGGMPKPGGSPQLPPQLARFMQQRGGAGGQPGPGGPPGGGNPRQPPRVKKSLRLEV